MTKRENCNPLRYNASIREIVNAPFWSTFYYKTKELYSVLEAEIDSIDNYLKELTDAVKISNIGKTLTIYNEHKHAYYIANEELNWQYRHKDMLLISTILRSKGDKLIYKPLKKDHSKLLPKKKVIKWLGFIYTLIDILYSYSSTCKYSFKYKKKTLYIYSKYKLALFSEDIKSLKLPKNLSIKLEYIK